MLLSRLRASYTRGSPRYTVLLFIITFAFSYFSISGVRGYMIAFLEYMSFSPSLIGAFASVVAAAGIAGKFVIGYLCDKMGCIKPFFYLTMAVVCISSFVIFGLAPHIAVMFLFFAISGTSHGTCLALSDSWILEAREDIRRSYGAVRGAGSLGWSLGLLLYGAAIAAFGFIALPVMAIFTAAISFVSGRKLPDVQKSHSKVITIGTLKELLKNFRYVYLVVVFLLTAFVIQADWVLNSIKAAQLGTPASIGVFLFVQAFCEVPFFFIFRWIQRRFKVSHLFAFGVFVYLIRIGLMRAAPDIGTMTIVAVTNSISFAPVHISSRLLFDAESPAHLKTAGQLIANAICVGLGGIIAPLVFGNIIASVGLDYASYILMAFTIIPLILAISFTRIPARNAPTD